MSPSIYTNETLIPFVTSTITFVCFKDADLSLQSLGTPINTGF